MIQQVGYEQDNYITNSSQVYGNDPRFRSSDMVGATWTGNAAASDFIIGTTSPRALTQRQLNDAIVNGVITGISRLGILEKHSEVIEVVQKLPLPTIVVDPPDLLPVQDMMTELTSVIREALTGLRDEIREDMSVLQREVLKNRDVGKSQAEEVRKELRRFKDTDFSQVVKEIRRIEIPSSFDMNPVLQEISNTRSILDQRLASLQGEVYQLKDGLAATRVVMPQTQPMMNQVLQPGTMRRILSTSSVQPQAQTCMSPRVVAENVGPVVTLPSVPLGETVQMKVCPVGSPIVSPVSAMYGEAFVQPAVSSLTSTYGQSLSQPAVTELMGVAETIVTTEASVFEDGRISPPLSRAGTVSPYAPRAQSPPLARGIIPRAYSWGAQYADSATL